MTQQNAALVEEAAAAESLQGQAEHLTQVVSVFKIGAATAAVAAPVPAASRPTLMAAPVKAARSKAKPPAVGVKPKLVANARARTASRTSFELDPGLRVDPEATT